MAKSKYFEIKDNQYVSSHPRVKKAWGWGGASAKPDAPLYCTFSLLLDNGERKDFDFTDKKLQGAFEDADRYLDSLNQDACQTK